MGEKRFQTEWAEKSFSDPIPVSDEWSHQLRIRLRVPTERRSRRLNGTFKQGDAAIIERVRQRSGRVNPRQPILLEWQGAEECRAQPQRVNSRADIVYKARQSEFHRARAAADRLFRLEHDDRP